MEESKKKTLRERLPKDDLLGFLAEGLTYTEIAKRLGAHISSVSHLAREVYGLPSARPQKQKGEDPVEENMLTPKSDWNWTPESEDRILVAPSPEVEAEDEAEVEAEAEVPEKKEAALSNIKLEINGRYDLSELANTLQDINSMLETQGGEFWLRLEIRRAS